MNDNRESAYQIVNPRAIWSSIKMSVFKTYEGEMYRERKSNLVDWRSQALSSIEQPTCVYLNNHFGVK